MANRMIHTPSYLADADVSYYWTSNTGVNVSGGRYTETASGGDTVLSRTFDSQSGWTLGLRFKYTSAYGGEVFVTWFDGASTQLELRFQSATGLFYVYKNSATLQSGATVLRVGVDYYVEWKVEFSNTGTSILHIDGQTDSGINSTSIDTTTTANNTASMLQIQFSRVGRSAWYVDQIYLNDNTGGSPNDTFWGPITIVTLSPTGAGNAAEWTPLSGANYENVDDATPDEDTTYNSTTTSTKIDSFAMSNTGYSSGSVLGVEWAAQMKRGDASSTCRIAPVYRISTTNYVGSDILPAQSYTIERENKTVSPATSSAWTLSELDGIEVGYKRTVE